MGRIYERFESHEIYGSSDPGPLVLTCEHASRRIPAPLRTTANDRKWLSTHWGWDIGARTVCPRDDPTDWRSGRVRALLASGGRESSPEPRAPGALRRRGDVLSFNEGLTIEEVDRRLEKYHAPYHAAIDRVIGARMSQPGDVMLLAVHSFTPQLGDDRREMDVGLVRSLRARRPPVPR